MATRTRSSIPARLLVRKEPLGEFAVSTPRFDLPSPPTLLIITNEHHFPQRRPKPSQDGQVISNLNLTRFIDDNGLDRDDLREPAVYDPVRRQHAHCAQDDSGSQKHACIFLCCVLEFPGFDDIAADDFV